MIIIGVLLGFILKSKTDKTVKKVGKKYIYVLASTRYLFRYKIGISNNVTNRRKNIDESLSGSVVELFSLSFYFAFEIEQLMHLLYKPLNAKMKGSGKTEWFWMIAPITPVCLLILIWVVQQVFAVVILSLILILIFEKL